MNNKVELPVSRRQLMRLSAGFIGTVTLASVLGLEAHNPQPASAQNDMTPDQALAKLMEGNKRFVENKSIDPHQSMARLTQIAPEQNPFATIISCSDSRVPPEIVFDQGLGDLFVVRDAGEVVTSAELGSLEYGTLVAGSKVLLVLGHEDCGAVKATMVGEKVPGQIGSILTEIEPAVVDYKGQQDDKASVQKAVKANVLLQLGKLQKSTVLTELVKSGKLKIVGAYYDLDQGQVSLIS